MEDKVLRSRGRALEESFFARKNQELLDKLREQERTRARKDALSEASGIRDDGVLSRLVELDICSESVAAATLVPLVEVAWADGTVHGKEREAILRASEAAGVAPGSISHDLLENWLEQAPDARLMEVWRDYIAALCAEIGPDAKEKLEQDILGRAREVAEAAGGFLGLGKISAKEREILDELERAFR